MGIICAIVLAIFSVAYLLILDRFRNRIGGLLKLKVNQELIIQMKDKEIKVKEDEICEIYTNKKNMLRRHARDMEAAKFALEQTEKSLGESHQLLHQMQEERDIILADKAALQHQFNELRKDYFELTKNVFYPSAAEG